MDLNQCREKIDAIDDQLVRLFRERMEVSAAVSAYKQENNLPIYDAKRERSLLARVADLAGEEMDEYTRVLYTTIMDLSKAYQQRRLQGPQLHAQLQQALDETPQLFPQRAIVACQGVEGAYSQLAAEKFFRLPSIMYCNSFESVFSAIDAGLCQYGVLPLENSTAGSVTKIYDLMIRYNFYIVRSLRLKVDHNLLVKPGVTLSQVREVFSHEQAISQCQGFLSQHPEIKVTVCENTAMAAKLVAESPRQDVAALSSRACADQYGLSCLCTSVQDTGNNYTRFICISKKLEVYPGADRTSIMMVVSHKPGSLYHVLSRFYALGVNLRKLESRPIPDRDFEFMFYFDIDASVYSPHLSLVLSDLAAQTEEFRYLGSYSEII